MKNIQVVGLGFLDYLGLMFIGLKLAGFIGWSWLLVLLPLYIIPVSTFIVATVVFIISLFYRNREEEV